MATISIQLRFVTHNPRCKKCPHGPYYYAFWKAGGKTKCAYIGKTLNAEQQAIFNNNEADRGRPRPRYERPGLAIVEPEPIDYEQELCNALGMAKGLSREEYRKAVYHGSRKKGISHNEKVALLSNFTKLCDLKGWKRPREASEIESNGQEEQRRIADKAVSDRLRDFADKLYGGISVV